MLLCPTDFCSAFAVGLQLSWAGLHCGAAGALRRALGMPWLAGPRRSREQSLPALLFRPSLPNPWAGSGGAHLEDLVASLLTRTGAPRSARSAVPGFWCPLCCAPVLAPTLLRPPPGTHPAAPRAPIPL